jgi:hypothetical protein
MARAPRHHSVSRRRHEKRELKDRARRDPLSAADTDLDDDLRPLRHEGHEASAAVHLLIERIRRDIEPDPLLRALFDLRLEDKSPADIQAALGLPLAAFDKAMRGLKKRLLEIFQHLVGDQPGRRWGTRGVRRITVL